MATPATAALKYPDSDGMPLPDGRLAAEARAESAEARIAQLETELRRLRGE